MDRVISLQRVKVKGEDMLVETHARYTREEFIDLVLSDYPDTS